MKPRGATEIQMEMLEKHVPKELLDQVQICTSIPGKVYASKNEFQADVLDPNTDTTQDDFRQDLEIKVTRVSMGAKTKK